ncbi:hypothetical protein [Bacillus sp. FJAT-22090]|uniref:hypothetical protein n=1 Tax=Bacillus sp. FJAT-22090 TaxID=1581038 RepID=UPI0011AB1E9B|nr:hypothetical protein [Bacillus sp. FJAT-22090]
MDKQRLKHLKAIINTDFRDRHDIPQCHFSISELKWLIEQAEDIESIKTFMVDCDADERVVQPYEVLGRISSFNIE